MHKERAAQLRAEGNEEAARRLLDEAGHIKKQLPVFCYQATFKFSRRRIADAQPNGLVMCDFDYITNLQEVVLQLPSKIGTWSQAGIVLAHFTPSMKGLRIVFKGDPALDYVTNQHKMAELLGLPLDEACKDLARCSFAVPKSYILYLDDELFTYNQPLKSQLNGNKEISSQRAAVPAGVAVRTGDHPAEPAAVADVPSAETSAQTPSVEPCFKGIPYADIIAEWWKLTGGEPQIGERNMKLHRLATNLRYICDGNEALMLQIMPRYGLSETEVRNLIHSACEPRLMAVLPKTLVAVLNRVKPKAASSQALSLGARGSMVDGEFMTKAENEYWLARLANIKLPAGLKETIESVAIENRVNALVACLPVIYTVATGISYKIWDGQWYRLSGTSVLIGAAASGKSFCKDVVKAWLSPIKLTDQANREIENNYKRNREATGMKGMKSTRPQVCIRQLPATASLATLNERSQNAKRIVWNVPHTQEYTQHVHLITVEYEFATIVKSLKQNFSSYLDFLIKAHQDEEVGVDYRNDASANGIRNIHWNQLYAGNMMDFKRLIPDSSVLNGMPLRLMIGFIPENSYDMNVQTGILNAHRRSEILAVAYNLDKLTGNVDVRPLSDRMFKWSKRKAKEAEDSNDKVADYIRRRCGSTIGMRAGVISAVIRNIAKWDKLPVVVLNDEKGIVEADKEWARQLEFTDDDFRLAEFVADYCFEQQYKLFKRPIEKAMQESVLPSEGIVFKQERERTIDLFNKLPNTFTSNDVADLFGVSLTTARSYCSRWKQDAKVKYFNHKYQKL